MNRRFFIAGLGAALPLLAGCVELSRSELQTIGSRITPATINFGELYTYAERSSTAYLSEAKIRAKYPKVVRVASPGSNDVQYYLEQDDVAQTQTITVRGTANKKNLSEDMEFRVRDDRQVDIPVHVGFDRDARAVYEDVKPYLKPGYRTYVTGHSLGGAIAAIITIYLIEDGVKVERVFTFGQPRFTTADGVKRLSFLPLSRVVDELDIIPLVPPATATDPKYGPYEHVGPEVILLEGPDFVYLDAHDANRISIGEFWRSLGYADLKDHAMKKYLARIKAKIPGATEVPYNDRLKYVAMQPKKTATAN